MTIHLVELQWYLEEIFIRLCLWYPKEHINKQQQHFSAEETYIKFLYLRQNMCLGHSEADNQHAQQLLEIGAGSTMNDNKMIQVPQSMVYANFNGLINRIYPGIGNSRAQNDQYFLDHIILCSRNDQVHDINEAILQQFNPNA